MIDKEKVVDLSHRILRRGENFPFHSDYIGNRSSEDWYVMSNIFIGSLRLEGFCSDKASEQKPQTRTKKKRTGRLQTLRR